MCAGKRVVVAEWGIAGFGSGLDALAVPSGGTDVSRHALRAMTAGWDRSLSRRSRTASVAAPKAFPEVLRKSFGAARRAPGFVRTAAGVRRVASRAKCRETLRERRGDGGEEAQRGIRG